VIPDPGNLQAFNRYSYCANNPLVYVDPSGHIFGIDDAIIIAIVIAMAQSAAIGALVGAAVAAVSGGNILQGALTGAISGALVCAGGLVGGAMAGVVNASITGGDLGQGALYGAIGAAAGGLTGMGIDAMGIDNSFVQAGASMVAGGIVGGGITALAGGNFGQGFVNGAVGAAAGYFASIGMTKILQQSPANASSEKKQQEAAENLEVDKSEQTSQGATTQGATTPDGRIIPAGGTNGIGRTSSGLRDEALADGFRDTARVLNDRMKAFGERSNSKYGWFCDKQPDGQFYTRPGDSTCIKWGYHRILSF
jgi:hypothetical protein